MPRQISFAQAKYHTKRNATRRDRLLGEMEWVVPWAMLLGVLAPYYDPKAGTGAGAPPNPGSRRLLEGNGLTRG